MWSNPGKGGKKKGEKGAYARGKTITLPLGERWVGGKKKSSSLLRKRGGKGETETLTWPETSAERWEGRKEEPASLWFREEEGQNPPDVKSPPVVH